MRKNKKYAHPYYEWEDFKGGMYSDEITETGIKNAMKILGTKELCKEAMYECLIQYKCSAETNLLSDVDFEYHSDRAWLGAACCNYKCGCTVSEVRNAWWLLTEEQRMVANSIADEAIEKWKSKLFGYEQLSLF